MKEILLDSLLDTLKVVPFLFLAFLLIEYLEHHLNKKNYDLLTKNKVLAPIFGGFLGMIPQCGFSSLASNLFSGRVITIGTLIAVYLSTSDEMFPLLISGGIPLSKALLIILSKALIGIFSGLIIDLIFKNKNKNNINIVHENCDTEECHCNENIFLASLIHTLKIALYLLIASIIISLVISYIGEDTIKTFISNKKYLSYFIASIVGLIPNCASSVIITEIYLNNVITLGTLFSGLLTSSGVGILILFRTNKNIKENLLIVSLIYSIGIIFGILIDVLGIIL